jgi:hypothetical protein
MPHAMRAISRGAEPFHSVATPLEANRARGPDDAGVATDGEADYFKGRLHLGLDESISPIRGQIN